MSALFSLNSETERQIFLENPKSEKSCCQSKVLKTLVGIVGVAIPIIFVVLGALGLAGCASLPLLIIGGAYLGLTCLGLIAFLISSIVLKIYLDRNGLVANESI
ncbi:hypothetical protein SBV42_04925 [Chlamydia crocodili]|uniref:Inclusion membrane protein n=1 Tax=Chlamydia crocodili TaxID=2766982 RepID=A0ABX8CF71_9CHLA|nr:hypothetical protein [Chlamydia crocodili]QVE49094.1 hypothetical protein H9Q19_05295 [Chlamydia crocodili]